VSQQYIPLALRKIVKERAKYCCEYCLVCEEDVLLAHHIDHIVAEQHGGETVLENLACACIHCNRNKGPNIASIDLETRQLVPLFHPRTDNWHEHFKLDIAYIQPLTSIARATVRLLQLNQPERIRIRQALIAVGRYPPG